MAITKEPARIPTGDLDTDRAIDVVRSSIGSMLREPIMTARTFLVTLVDATTLVTKHGLGRRLVTFSLTPVKGATTPGQVDWIAGDDTTEVRLQANGYGATVTAILTVY